MTEPAHSLWPETCCVILVFPHLSTLVLPASAATLAPGLPLDGAHLLEGAVVDAANLKQCLQESIKVRGEAGTLGGRAVTAKRKTSKSAVTSELASFPKGICNFSPKDI